MSPVWTLKRLVSVFKNACRLTYCRLCRHCRNLAEGGCLLSRFHFTRCRYFLGHVACRNLPWQGLATAVITFSSSIYAFQITLKLRTALKPWAENIKINTITVQEYFKVLTCKACLSYRLQLWRDCGDWRQPYSSARGVHATRAKLKNFPPFEGYEPAICKVLSGCVLGNAQKMVAQFSRRKARNNFFLGCWTVESRLTEGILLYLDHLRTKTTQWVT